MGGKAFAVLIFFIRGAFFRCSAEVVGFISGDGFGFVFSADISVGGGNSVSVGTGYRSCNCFTEDRAIELLIVVAGIDIGVISRRIDFFTVCGGNRLCFVIFSGDFHVCFRQIERGAMFCVCFSVAEFGASNFIA